MKYKLERLKQMQAAAAVSAKLPTFGQLFVMPWTEYTNQIDTPDNGRPSPDTPVVVHLFEDFMADCVRLNFRLEKIAAKYDHVKFLCVCASDVKKDLDPEELPCAQRTSRAPPQALARVARRSLS